jgi:peptidyl-prolyl cis-trans isomerase SurA
MRDQIESLSFPTRESKGGFPPSAATPTRFAVAAVSALAFVVLLCCFGCSSNKGGPGVVASVNGRKIERSEVDKYYNNQTADAPQKPSEEQADSLRLSIVKELIDNEILMQRAEKLGLLATDDEVNSKLAEIKAPFTQEQFDSRLKAKGITLDDFKRDLRRSITVDKVLNKEVTSKINVTDADIAAYYEQHKAEFNFIEPQYHLAQIVVTNQPNPQVKTPNKAQNDIEARKKIQTVENRLDSGEDFTTVAMNYSEQPETAQNGGDLGFVPESSLKGDKIAYDAIGKLKPGQYTPPLPIADPNRNQVYGYRVVKLISREAAGQRDLKDPRVQQAIREQIRDRREQLLKAAYYDVIHDEAKIENFFAEEILKKAGPNK